MTGAAIETKPSSLNILKNFYVRVLPLEEYIKENVSENRFAKVRHASHEHEAMCKLIETAYVCINPQFHMIDDGDGLDGPSILSIGEHATQTEVEFSKSLLTKGGASRIDRATNAPWNT
jgi:hypothetical protein